MHQFAVDVDSLKSGVADFDALVVETGCAKNDVHGLPLAGRLGGIHKWLGASPPLFAFRLGLVPAGVDATEIATADLGLAEAIEDLHFISPHHIDAGIRLFGNHELQMHLAVAKVLAGQQVGNAFVLGRTIEENPAFTLGLDLGLVLERICFLHRAPVGDVAEAHEAAC